METRPKLDQVKNTNSANVLSLNPSRRYFEDLILQISGSVDVAISAATKPRAIST